MSTTNAPSTDELRRTASFTSQSAGRRYQRRSDVTKATADVSGVARSPTTQAPKSLAATSVKGSQADVLEPSDEIHENIKVIMLGDSSVGKTCLMVRFNDGAFNSGNFISTVGIDFRTKVMQLDGKKLHLQIWDTAGQERFRSITASYYHDADAILLLYDVTNWSSFEHLTGWLSSVRELAPKDVSLLLVANKTDLTSSRKVGEQASADLAQEHNLCLLEVSAKNGENVTLAFEAVARAVLAKRAENGSSDSRADTFDLNKYVESNSTKSGCGC